MIRSTLLHPVTLAFFIFGVAAGIVGQFALATLGLVLAITSASLLAMRQPGSSGFASEVEELSNEERAQLAPVRKLRNEIREIVEARKSEVSISVVGAEAVQEADRILEQCAKLVRVRRELRKTLFSKSTTSKELEALERDLEQASSDHERETLRIALEARRLEASHYQTAETALERIEANLRQAQAALSEMRARLATHSTATEAAPASELEETIGRLRSLGTSLEEAEDWLKGQA